MVYKILCALLTLALIGTILYFTNKEEPTSLTLVNGTGKSTNAITQQDIDFVQEFFDAVNVTDTILIGDWIDQNKRIDSIHTGSEMDADIAAIRWKSFTKWNRKRGNLVRELRPNGFAFGKHRLRKMLQAIDARNRIHVNNGDLDSLIYGVRFNLTHSIDSVTKKPFIDLLGVPIMANGKNYVDLSKPPSKAPEKLAKSPLLLNTSSPCPTMCN